MTTLSFWGGVDTVTGSKYLLEVQKRTVLVDCGLFQGLKALRERNWQEPPFDPRQIEAIALTHAHIDHVGYLPRLVVRGFRGPVYCSRATAELLRIVLPDSARLQEEDADYRNRHNLTSHHPALPIYTEEDARETLKLVQPINGNDGPTEILRGIQAEFFHAGHLLGSRSILLDIADIGDDRRGRRILFSGDLGRYDRPILHDPAPPPACDYLLVESTYGNRLHDPEDPKTSLERIIKAVVQRKGPLLIPAFAIGRTQELLYLIRELEDEGRIPKIPVRVDSPMAAEATRVYGRLWEEHDATYAALVRQGRKPLQTHSMRIASKREESKKLNEETGARIIISASGMMTGGRVLHHAARLLPEKNATIAFVGFQGEGTTGRYILDGAPFARIFKQEVPIHCHIEKIASMSAHMDWQGVLRWLSDLPGAPRRVFITHGEPEAASALRDHITERYEWDINVPHYGDKVELT
jgi:metallo-beta-lactamase family protein